MRRDDPFADWVNILYFGLILIYFAIIFGIFLGGNSYGYIQFIKVNFVFAVPFFLVLAELVFNLYGISIAPFGSYNPKQYPAQEWFGYKGAIIASILTGLLFGIFFYTNIQATKELWLPVPVIFGGQQIVADYFAMAFTGQAAQGFMTGFIPTIFENPSLMYIFIIPFWIIPRLILRRTGLDFKTANMVAILIYVALVALIFPAFHFAAYQRVEAAYVRGTIFTAISLPIDCLTGMPFGSFITHFANNYAAVTVGAVSRGQVVIPPG